MESFLSYKAFDIIENINAPNLEILDEMCFYCNSFSNNISFQNINFTNLISKENFFGSLNFNIFIS